MKQIFRKILFALLPVLLIAGCQREDLGSPDSNNRKEKTVIQAYIDDNEATRVAYHESETGMDVVWSNSGESFVVIDDKNQPYVFEQISSGFEYNDENGTKFNENSEKYTAYYPATAYDGTAFNIDFSEQTGDLTPSLNMMYAESCDIQSDPLRFSQMTAIVKQTFLINNGETNVEVNNVGITQVILYDIQNVKNMEGSDNIKVNRPNSSSGPIYIYLPHKAKELNKADKQIYGPGSKINMLVKYNGTDYSATITVPDGKQIKCGTVYELRILLKEATECYLPVGYSYEWGADTKTFFNTIITNNIGDCTSIKFIANVANPTGTQIGESGAYMYKNDQTLEICTSKNVFIFNSQCTKMFQDLNNVTSIDFNDCINTSNVTEMDYMFNGCNTLTSLDLSSFNTTKVTNMNRMFYNCNALTSLDLSSFNTAIVTSMEYMFYGCNNLTSLDLSNFNTAKVTSMEDMFAYCTYLTSLDISNFETTNVKNMMSMFSGCKNLGSIIVNPDKFVTINVDSMEAMFNDCHVLTTFDLNRQKFDISKFNTTKVTSMKRMFAGCKALASLDLSNFKTENVIDMYWMFFDCSNLTELDLGNFNTEKVQKMAGMFRYCSKMEKLNLYSFNLNTVYWSPTGFAKNTEEMFLKFGATSGSIIYINDYRFSNISKDKHVEYIYSNPNQPS